MSNLAVTIGIIVAAFFIGCMNGYAVRDGAAKSSAAKAYKAAEGQRIILQGQLDVVSAKYEIESKRASRVAVERYNTIREYYPAHPVDPSCAVPELPYSLLANTVADANVAAIGEPSGVVRSASSATASSH